VNWNQACDSIPGTCTAGQVILDIGTDGSYLSTLQCKTCPSDSIPNGYIITHIEIIQSVFGADPTAPLVEMSVHVSKASMAVMILQVMASIRPVLYTVYIFQK
jgi:hypothetical protein